MDTQVPIMSGLEELARAEKMDYINKCKRIAHHLGSRNAHESVEDYIVFEHEDTGLKVTQSTEYCYMPRTIAEKDVLESVVDTLTVSYLEQEVFRASTERSFRPSSSLNKSIETYLPGKWEPHFETMASDAIDAMVGIRHKKE